MVSIIHPLGFIWHPLEGAGGWWFNLFSFQPQPWGNDPIWRAYFFQGGLLQPPPSDDFPMLDFLFLDDHLIYPTSKCFDGPLPVIKGGRTHTDGLVNGIHWGYKPTDMFLFAPFITVVWALLVDISPPVFQHPPFIPCYIFFPTYYLDLFKVIVYHLP